MTDSSLPGARFGKDWKDPKQKKERRQDRERSASNQGVEAQSEGTVSMDPFANVS